MGRSSRALREQLCPSQSLLTVGLMLASVSPATYARYAACKNFLKGAGGYRSCLDTSLT